MKKSFRVIGTIAAILTVLSFAMVSCGGGGGGDADLPGTVSIGPANPKAGDNLKANYTGGGTEGDNLQYRWYKGTSATNTALISPAETDDTLVDAAAGFYKVEVKATGFKWKASAVKEVIDDSELDPVPGSIAITAADGLYPGKALTASYTGTATINEWQWFKVSGENDVPITTATTGTYTPADEGSYKVRVGATGYRAITSDPVEVAYIKWDGDLEITYTGTDLLVGIKLKAEYDGTETEYDIQWYLDDDPIEDADKAELTTAKRGSYTVGISKENYQELVSEPVMVLNPAMPGTIALDPDPTADPLDPEDFFPGTTLKVTYTPDDAEEPTYQWYKDGEAIEGADEDEYETDEKPGTYYVVLSLDGFEDLKSDDIVINWLDFEGKLTIEFDGENTLTAVYDGSETGFEYQWYKDGELIEDADGDEYEFEDGLASYTVVISDTKYNDLESDPFVVDWVEVACPVNTAGDTWEVTVADLAGFKDDDEVWIYFSKDAQDVDGWGCGDIGPDWAGAIKYTAISPPEGTGTDLSFIMKFTVKEFLEHEGGKDGVPGNAWGAGKVAIGSMSNGVEAVTKVEVHIVAGGFSPLK
jgi:uncharacterized protein YdeI (BOF family)